jgi:transcriptional regulator with XRE-family HTH domain
MRKPKPVQPRPIREIAVDLRKDLGLTQQAMATKMGWAISTTIRFEHGAQPSARMLSEMLETAYAEKLYDLAAEIQIHLNVALGPNFPVTPNEMEQYFVLIARRIFQNRKRHQAFLRFAAPEIEILKAENLLRKEHQDQLSAYLGQVDAYNRQKETEK